MIYRIFFSDNEIMALRYIDIDDFVNIKLCSRFNLVDDTTLLDLYHYCIINGFLIFGNRAYCNDMHKLEELYNLYTLMGGKHSDGYVCGPEIFTLYVDCAKLLGQI